MGQDSEVITLEPAWYRCENNCEFRGPSSPKRCPVCGSTEIEMLPHIDLTTNKLQSAIHHAESGGVDE